MIWLEELTSRKKVSKLFNSYAATFPEAERRDKKQFLDLAEFSEVFIFSIKNDESEIGYCILWQLDDFYFLEHFEVLPECRNRNFGSEALQCLIEKFEKLILESEPESLSEIAKRRISFYKRNGFNIIDKNYVQPSYGVGKPEVNLWLLSNFDVENIKSIIAYVYEKVYS